MTYLHVVEITNWHAWKIVGVRSTATDAEGGEIAFFYQSGNDRRTPQFLWQAVTGSHPTADA